jgi:hypothetical protein
MRAVLPAIANVRGAIRITAAVDDAVLPSSSPGAVQCGRLDSSIERLLCRGQRGVRSARWSRPNKIIAIAPIFPFVRERAWPHPHISSQLLLDRFLTRVSLSLLLPSAIAPHSLSVSRKPEAGSSRSCICVSLGRRSMGRLCRVVAALLLLVVSFSFSTPDTCRSDAQQGMSCVCLSSVLLNISAAEE